MHLSTLLDCDVVAVEQTDELTLLVELSAPEPVLAAERPPATLQVVLDRSGSMAGDRLEGAQTALLALVDRLDPRDRLGVVAFDSSVQVVVPTGPLVDKAAAKRAIAAVEPGGSTDLSAGYLRGLQEVQRATGGGAATLLLISDGHANAGVKDPDRLGQVAAQARTGGVTTSTLGFGLGYDERLLAALARGGSGDELFAEQADAAVALISGQVEGLLDQVAQAVTLRVTWGEHVDGLDVLNEVPLTPLAAGAQLELGSFYGGEARRLLLTLHVPGIAALGLAQVATLELVHVALPDLVQHTSTLPVMVNVVPGDEAAGRVPDPQVRSEALFQQAQRAKRTSSGLLSQGRADEASALLRSTGASLRSASSGLPDAYADELLAEAELTETLARESLVDAGRAAKTTSYDTSLKSRTRGRRTRGSTLVLRWADGAPGSGSTLRLEDWELERLSRLVHPDLAAALRPVPGPRDSGTALLLAGQLGDEPAARFFSAAAGHDGFTVERAA